ncbi:hypothetical protein [Streptomyces albofaciens]|nr:hypothetical protein [Streptomyces albofaciens]
MPDEDVATRFGISIEITRRRMNSIGAHITSQHARTCTRTRARRNAH